MPCDESGSKVIAASRTQPTLDRRTVQPATCRATCQAHPRRRIEPRARDPLAHEMRFIERSPPHAGIEREYASQRIGIGEKRECQASTGQQACITTNRQERLRSAFGRRLDIKTRRAPKNAYAATN